MRRCLLGMAMVGISAFAMADVVVEKVGEDSFKVVEDGITKIYTTASMEAEIDELKRERQQYINRKNTAIARQEAKFEPTIFAYNEEISVKEEALSKAHEELGLVQAY